MYQYKKLSIILKKTKKKTTTKYRSNKNNIKVIQILKFDYKKTNQMKQKKSNKTKNNKLETLNSTKRKR
jgi:hypothetical protein